MFQTTNQMSNLYGHLWFMFDRVQLTTATATNCSITKLGGSNTPCSEHCSEKRHHPLMSCSQNPVSSSFRGLETAQYTDGQHQIQSNITFQ